MNRINKISQAGNSMYKKPLVKKEMKKKRQKFGFSMSEQQKA